MFTSFVATVLIIMILNKIHIHIAIVLLVNCNISCGQNTANIPANYEKAMQCLLSPNIESSDSEIILTFLELPSFEAEYSLRVVKCKKINLELYLFSKNFWSERQNYLGKKNAHSLVVNKHKTSISKVFVKKFSQILETTLSDSIMNNISIIDTAVNGNIVFEVIDFVDGSSYFLNMNGDGFEKVNESIKGTITYAATELCKKIKRQLQNDSFDEKALIQDMDVIIATHKP